MRCACCPVPAGSPCSGPCAWAAEGDPIKLKHIVNRSATLAGAPAPTPRPLSRAEKPRVPLGAKPKGG